MTKHECTSTPGTALVLRAGLRSSLAEQCAKCGKWNTWIQTVKNEIVSLDMKGRGKRG